MDLVEKGGVLSISFKFWKKSRDYCHIWILEAEPSNLSKSQKKFNSLMEEWEIPSLYSEGQLVQDLKDFSDQCDCQIGYYLSADEISEVTQFSYQATSSPRLDQPIRRCRTK